jgi:hypothetical protein
MFFFRSMLLRWWGKDWVGANWRYETLSEIAGRGRNLLVVCEGCRRRRVLSGAKLARYFFVRRWDGRKHMIADRLRCIGCGARPSRWHDTAALPDGPEWGPQNEGDWRRLVARLRD